jgi:hypothetical protein
VDRRTLAVIVLGMLAVLAIGLVAGTLIPTLDSSGDSSGEGYPGGEERGGIDTETEDGLRDDPSPSILVWLSLAIAAVIAAGVVGVSIRYPHIGLPIAGVLVVLLLLATAAPSLEFQGNTVEENETAEGAFNETEPEGETGGGGPSGSVLLAVAGIVGALVLALGLVLRWPRGKTEPEEPDDAGEETGATALGEIAGRAADRIETGASGESENEVYRAWGEMTHHLDIENTETTTAREFQRAAVEAGMAPDDVRELTQLFERVRYGGEAATEDREQRAVAVLRRIESTYGDEE